MTVRETGPGESGEWGWKIIMGVFIRLAYTIRSWIVLQWLSAGWRAGKPVVAQSRKLGAPEQGGPRMQLQSKAGGLKAPWRVGGVSPPWKDVEAGV
jgi:hypothetical protein